jgi:hypothetical protein
MRKGQGENNSADTALKVTESFKRWTPAWGSTWAYRLFQQHHRQINVFYWSHVGAKQYAFAATSGFSTEDHASVLFTIPTPGNNNLDITLGEWGSQYSEFDNWVRLNALVAITGYLEVFLKTIVRASLESNPGVLHGASKAVDGVIFLKSNPKYSMKEYADDVAIGDWNKRIAKYERLFGAAPAVLKSNVADLEDLRRIRNGVTHTFGRASDDYDSIVDANKKPQKKVTEKKLIKTLALIGKIAKAIEEDLGGNHVGDFETVYFYHQWDKIFDDKQLTESKALKRKFGQVHGRSLSSEYFSGLKKYYDAV